MQKKRMFYLKPDQIDLNLTAPNWNKFVFRVDEIDIECGKLKLKMPEFFDFDSIEILVFEFPEKKHTFKRVEEK